MTNANFKIIEKLYSDHTFAPVWDEEWDPCEIQLVIDDLYASIWMDQHIWFEDDPADLKWLREEIDDYFKQKNAET